MALQITELKRTFIHGDKSLSDPNPSMSPEEVMKFHSGTYPELTNATIEGPTVKGGKAEYKAVTKAGKLG